MARCTICGKPAGFLRNAHPDCVPPRTAPAQRANLFPELDEYREREAAYKPTVDYYFNLNEQFQAAWRDGAYDGCVRLARECYRTLPLFAEYWHQEIHRLPNPVDALVKGTSLMVAASDRAALEEAQRVLSSTPLLQDWRELLAPDPSAAARTDALFEHVRRNPGVLQVGLRKQFGDVTYLCYLMEKLGRIHRTKSGRTYALKAT